MAYTKTNWVNDETELSAENFNKIENGIANVEPIKLLGIDITPEDYSIGDKYYNSEENKIYTATSSSTFDDGEEPTDGHFYLVLSDNANYYYDGETLVAVGGGKEPIIISEDEPSTEDGALLWVDTGELNSISSEVVNSLDGDETNKAPSVNATKEYLKGLIKVVRYSGTITTTEANKNYTIQVPTTTPEGYKPLYFVLDGNGWQQAQCLHTIIYTPVNSDNQNVVVVYRSTYNYGTATVYVKGVYIKDI